MDHGAQLFINEATAAAAQAHLALKQSIDSRRNAMSGILGRVGGDAQYFDEDGSAGASGNGAELRALLDSSFAPEKIQGLKRLIAMMSMGDDMSFFFPYAVKNIVSQSLEVRRLVYVYVAHYAEKKPDEALLCINTFQKDLNDPNPLIRALALRALSSIRVHIIVNLVVLAIQKCAVDPSPYVRKAAAHAIPKVFDLDRSQAATLTDTIATLLADGATMVLGSALSAFLQVCPDRFDLLHKQYRRICSNLPDFDGWGQIVAMRVLQHYARTQFVDPNKNSEKPPKLQDDHHLLLRCTRPLLQAANAAVVMAVASLYYYIAPLDALTEIAAPMVFLLHGTSREVKYLALQNISLVCSEHPQLFQDFYHDFFILANEPRFVKVLKLEILSCIANDFNIADTLREFQVYLHDPDKLFVIATIRAIGRCASRLPHIAPSCARGLLRLAIGQNEAVGIESITVIRALTMLQPQDHMAMLERLVGGAHLLQVNHVRAVVAWMAGELCGISAEMQASATMALKRLARSFASESVATKLEVLNSSAKLYARDPDRFIRVFDYILDQADLDESFDVRDRSRTIRALSLLRVTNGEQSNDDDFRQLAQMIFLTPRPTPKLSSAAVTDKALALNTLSLSVGHKAPGYEPVPPFSEQADSTVRSSPSDQLPVSKPAVQRVVEFESPSTAAAAAAPSPSPLPFAAAEAPIVTSLAQQLEDFLQDDSFDLMSSPPLDIPGASSVDLSLQRAAISPDDRHAATPLLGRSQEEADAASVDAAVDETASTSRASPTSSRRQQQSTPVKPVSDELTAQLARQQLEDFLNET
eukprot:jgi/Chlat1/8966/Chrsp94S08262